MPGRLFVFISPPPSLLSSDLFTFNPFSSIPSSHSSRPPSLPPSFPPSLPPYLPTRLPPYRPIAILRSPSSPPLPTTTHTPPPSLPPSLLPSLLLPPIVSNKPAWLWRRGGEGGREGGREGGGGGGRGVRGCHCLLGHGRRALGVF